MKNISRIVMLILALFLINYSFISALTMLNGGEITVTIPRGQGSDTDTFTLELKNNHQTESIHDLEINTEGRRMNWGGQTYHSREVVWIDVEDIQENSIQDDDNVNRVNYHRRNGRSETNVPDDDANVRGVGRLNTDADGVDNPTDGRIVETNLTTSIPPGGYLDLKLLIEDDGDDQDREIKIKPTNAQGRFFCMSYSNVEPNNNTYSPNSTGQPVNEIIIGEQEPSVYIPGDLLITPQSPNWVFSGDPVAEVTEGDITLGNPYILGGQVYVPITGSSTEPSIFTISGLQIDVGNFAEGPVIARIESWEIGGCPDYLILGEYYQSSEIPTLTEWGLIIFGIMLLGWMAWITVRRSRNVKVRV